MKRLYDGPFVHSRHLAFYREACEILSGCPIEVTVQDKLNCGKLRLR